MALSFYFFDSSQWTEIKPNPNTDNILLDDNEQNFINELQDKSLIEGSDIKPDLSIINIKLILQLIIKIELNFSHKKFDLNILFWNDKNLSDHSCYINLTQKFFTYSSKSLDNKLFTPILHLGNCNFYDDFLKLSQGKQFTETLDQRLIFSSLQKSENKVRTRKIVQYFRFLDSCIWNRYLWIGSENFKTSLELLINNYFQKHFNNNLYKSSVAHEYIELNSRLLNQNSITSFGIDSGHSKSIVPFNFQSETELICYTISDFARIYNHFKKFTLNAPEKIKLFLWDDKSETGISAVASEAGKGTKMYSKHEVLIQIFNNYLPIHETDHTNKNTSISDLFEIITDQTVANQGVDIILNDFLLDSSPNSTDNIVSTDYLLEWMSTDPQEGNSFLNTSQIDHKLWLFPISSFNLAMSEKFAQLGFEYFSKKWVMSDGADFINTPNAFRYKFTEFLLHLIEESGVNLFEENKHSLLEYLISVIKQDNKQAYIEAYPKMINIHQKFLKLSEELKIKKSGFTKWVINRVYNGVSDIFMEHLIHLMHFLAFSSNVQKHQMLEEVHFLYERWPDESSKETFFTQLNTYIMKW